MGQRFTAFQIWATLVVMTVPIAFLEVPKRQLKTLGNNAWIAVALSLLFGFLIYSMYLFIIRRSQTPFPAMLEEHFGPMVGRCLQVFYFLSELLIAAFGIRLFVEFAETNVLPGTPISVHITILLLVCFSALKAGLTTFIKTFEIVAVLGALVTVLILTMAFSQPLDLENLLPISNLNLKNLAIATASTSIIISRGFIILVLGRLAEDWAGLRRAVAAALFTYVLLITWAVLLVTVIFGSTFAEMRSFPPFAIVQVINIGGFIQNIDIIFIGVWIMGMFATTTGSWFIGLISLQQALRLENYRFLAAPTALIIGGVSIAMAENILEVHILSEILIPLFYAVVLFLIPFVMFIRILLKPGDSIQPTQSIPVQNMD
ncbi:MAG TPA: GerAB/ArcD/ProY family transporter [Syntrophomonadaceae bacterium]|nr:GerAB/ArcD/ProY family transporter [Syntrophomonadaceae bacterium]HPU48987.1 GerAB/ArcD/ProY family transporter [Syntrophomonadaceae bacterium]